MDAEYELEDEEGNPVIIKTLGRRYLMRDNGKEYVQTTAEELSNEFSLTILSKLVELVAEEEGDRAELEKAIEALTLRAESYLP